MFDHGRSSLMQTYSLVASIHRTLGRMRRGTRRDPTALVLPFLKGELEGVLDHYQEGRHGR